MPFIETPFYEKLGLTEEQAELLLHSDPNYLYVIRIALIFETDYNTAAKLLARGIYDKPIEPAQRPSHSINMHNPVPSFANDRKLKKMAIEHARRHNK